MREALPTVQLPRNSRGDSSAEQKRPTSILAGRLAMAACHGICLFAFPLNPVRVARRHAARVGDLRVHHRLYYLPAHIARFEFTSLVEFKSSSNSRARAPARGPLGYSRCPARPRALPRRPHRCAASRPVLPRIVSFSSDFAIYQRIYRTKGLPSRLMKGPSPRFSEFRCAGGLLVTGGRDDTEWYEF